MIISLPRCIQLICVQAVDFYPYGLNAKDATLPRIDDGFIELNINTQFSFFGDVFEKVFISTNGIIFFGEGSREYIPSPYPLVGTRSVAAYWVDSDPRRGGNIFYRETFDQSILNEISSKVQQSFVQYGSFRSIWALIITFNDVPRYGCDNCSLVVNHQTILTTDGVNSFVIFLYDKLDYSFAQIGFNAGDGERFYLVPKSVTFESGEYALKNSNIGRPGEWMFSIGEEISGLCNENKSLTVFPSRVLFSGNQDIHFSGPCFEKNNSIDVNFGSLMIKCELKNFHTVHCKTPYYDLLGKISIEIIQKEKIFRSFVFAYAGNTELQISDERKILGLNNVEKYEWVYKYITNKTKKKDGWTIQIFYLNKNGKLEKNEKFSNGNEINSTHFDDELLEKKSYKGILIYLVAQTEANVILQELAEVTRAQSCQDWYKKEPSNVEIKKIVDWESTLNPCSPRIPSNIPEIFGGFRQDPNCNTRNRACVFNPGANVCYRSVFNPNGVSTECCYNNANTLIIGPEGGGSLNMHDPSASITQHLLNDLYPFLLCCKWSANCDKYYEKRPSITSSGFIPPSPPILVSGDPHFTTMDGFEYQFNPVGEFIYLQTSQTEIQCRISQYQTYKASYFSAFAMKIENEDTIQIELNSRKKLVVKMASSLLDYGVYQFENITVDFINSSTVTIEMKSGVWMKIIAMSDILNAILTLEQKLKGKVYGLIGNWDDDIRNDLMLPNKTFIPINSSSEQIHDSFSLSWRTNEQTSLFTYPPGLAWGDYQNVSFRPFFGTPSDNPICQGDNRCMFDYHITNNINLSLSNIIIRKVKNNLKKELTSIAKTCVRQMRVPNGVVAVNRYNESAFTYELTCNSRYKTSGGRHSMCISGKLSNNLGSCEMSVESSSFRRSLPMLCFSFLLCYLFDIIF